MYATPRERPEAASNGTYTSVSGPKPPKCASRSGRSTPRGRRRKMRFATLSTAPPPPPGPPEGHAAAAPPPGAPVDAAAPAEPSTC